jgi:hypothetical protein
MNRWIADRGYGTGMALAFEGDPDFIRRSINFAINFLVQGEHVVRQLTPTFVVVNTSMERIEDALFSEAFPRERLKLAEQFPLDFPAIVKRLREGAGRGGQ